MIMIAPSVDPVCKIKPEFGICDGPKKFYFSQDKICKKDSPLECKGNGNQNSFHTRKACLKTCGDCASKPKRGPCKAKIQRYYFDEKQHRCKKFTYGGCGGNSNNYKTKQECFDTCGDCDSEPDTGPCKAISPRFYFDQDHETCKRFDYGGCGGNNNNYPTKKYCSTTCKDQPITEGGYRIFQKY